MQPVFQMHTNLTNFVALISPRCNFHRAIKISYTQMQWNACKSREIKNPSGCRDVFIIRALTSWILRDAAHWGSLGSQGGAICLLASSHRAQEPRQTLLLYFPLAFSTKYVQILLFRLKVGVVLCLLSEFYFPVDGWVRMNLDLRGNFRRLSDC